MTRATGSILLNLTEIGLLGKLWNSPIITKFADNLSVNGTNANAGELIGNRMFYDNDYMVCSMIFFSLESSCSLFSFIIFKVHRGKNYVSTIKMFSTRTVNTECTNSQNVSVLSFSH